MDVSHTDGSSLRDYRIRVFVCWGESSIYNNDNANTAPRYR
jgi:hypothetical protein